jgi:hypothetical protein
MRTRGSLRSHPGPREMRAAPRPSGCGALRAMRPHGLPGVRDPLPRRDPVRQMRRVGARRAGATAGRATPADPSGARCGRPAAHRARGNRAAMAQIGDPDHPSVRLELRARWLGRPRMHRSRRSHGSCRARSGTSLPFFAGCGVGVPALGPCGHRVRCDTHPRSGVLLRYGPSLRGPGLLARDGHRRGVSAAQAAPYLTEGSG